MEDLMKGVFIIYFRLLGGGRKLSGAGRKTRSWFLVLVSFTLRQRFIFTLRVLLVLIPKHCIPFTEANATKMPRMEDILNLPVQDPICPEFSAAHINWVKLESGSQGGDVIALIPFTRVDDFVKGESSNPECPASFRIESRRKRPVGSIARPRVDGYLEYTL